MAERLAARAPDYLELGFVAPPKLIYRDFEGKEDCDRPVVLIEPEICTPWTSIILTALF